MPAQNTYAADLRILERVKHELTQVFGNRIDQILVFGSRAQGKATADSDYDIAIFLKDMHSLWDEAQKTGPISLKLYIDTGADIDIHSLPPNFGASRVQIQPPRPNFQHFSLRPIASNRLPITRRPPPRPSAQTKPRTRLLKPSVSLNSSSSS